MMTESVLTTPIQRTELAEILTASAAAASVGPVPELAAYRGVLTPQHLDAPERETAALLFGAAVHDLGWLRRVAVRGEDRSRWLSGMVTNSVEELTAGNTANDKSANDKSAYNKSAYNLVLNAQGRIQGDLYVWHEGGGLELEITADQAEPLLAHLDRFIIMDDVELVSLDEESALGLTGPKAEQVLASLGIAPLAENLTSAEAVASGSSSGSTWTVPTHLRRMYGTMVPHYALWVKTDQIAELWKAVLAAGASAVGAAALETLRVVEGIPAYGIDIQSRDLAQETSQNRALHYTKGCYLGQEIVERIRSRGQVHRHLRSLELNPASNSKQGLPQAGSELRMEGADDDSKPAAVLTSVASLQLQGTQRIYALAMVRAEAEVGNRTLTYPGGTASILNVPPQLTIPAGPTAAEETP